MKIDNLQDSQTKFVFYSIRERLAAIKLAKFARLELTNMSAELGFDSWDVIYKDEDQGLKLAEIKVRKRSSDDFSNWIFEKKKYDELTSLISSDKAKASNIKPVFIVLFNDLVAIWDVTKIDPNSFKSENLRATSVDGSQDKRDKEVTYLSLSDAIIYDFQVNMEELDNQARLIFDYKYPNNNIII